MGPKGGITLDTPPDSTCHFRPHHIHHISPTPESSRRRVLREKKCGSLSLLAHSQSEFEIGRHDGDPFGVNGAQIAHFEESHQVCLCRLLESQQSQTLEATVPPDDLSDLTHQTLKGPSADEQFGALLEPSDLAKCDGTFTSHSSQRGTCTTNLPYPDGTDATS